MVSFNMCEECGAPSAHTYTQSLIRLAVDPRPLRMSQKLCALYDHFLILLVWD